MASQRGPPGPGSSPRPGSRPAPPGHQQRPQPQGAPKMSYVGPPSHAQQQMQIAESAPSLFDLFYEEFLTQLINSGNMADVVPEEFMKLQTDIDRVEYLINLGSFVQEFEIQGKVGIKSLEKSVKYREEGNKMFQTDQAMQSILFYNKSLAYAPHPTYENYQKPELDRPGRPGVQFQDNPQGKITKRNPPSKYEALALCYANRSAALRKLCQYEDCLKDIARAAKFGYPKENLYKLWERKAKCYQGLKKFDMALKCYRQALTSLKESALSDNQKTLKSHEIQGLLKDLRTNHMFLSFEDDDAPLTGVGTGETHMMGATGPIIIVPDVILKRDRKPSEIPVVEPPPPMAKMERIRSFRRKKKEPVPDAPIPEKTPQPSAPPGGVPNGAGDTVSQGSGGNDSTSSLHRTTSMRDSAADGGGGGLYKANSQMSISQLSGTGIKPDIEVPELTWGQNARMPSASLGIDLRFSPDRGRFFVATQDLSPGDVILREEPYAAVLESIFRVNHCAHCLKKMPTPIPCYTCATVQYCSEFCRDLSWGEYHRIECGILGYLEPSRYLGKMPHLALRIVTKTGMQNLIQHSMVSMLPQQMKNGQGGGAEGGCDSSGMGGIGFFDPTSYRSVHNLATNTDKRPFEDLIKKTAEAIFMAKCLKYNGFFGPTGPPQQQQQQQQPGFPSDTKRAEIFISSLLLRHLQIASTNGLEMAEALLKNLDINQFDIIPVGGAIFPTMSFFNHSCFPNAQRLGYQNFQVIRILRTVPRGEEVNIDYGFDFYANSKEVRQKRAEIQYHFKCVCQACTEDWPVYNQLMGKGREFKVRLNQELQEELSRQAAAYQIGMDLMVRLDIPRAMPVFRDYLMVLNELVVHPDPRYIDCEEAYKQCMWLENRGYRVKPTGQFQPMQSGMNMASLPVPQMR